VSKNEAYENSIYSVIEKYRGTVFSIALTHTKCKSDAEDVFQDVFVAYWKADKKFSDEEHRKAWLIKTTLNLCKKNYHRSIWRRAVPLSEAEGEIFAFQSERENEVFIAMQKMSPKIRSVIHLYYFEEMSVKEISRITGRREGTVRMQLSRGRDFIRDILSGKE